MCHKCITCGVATVDRSGGVCIPCRDARLMELRRQSNYSHKSRGDINGHCEQRTPPPRRKEQCLVSPN
jgi:hypothetical protein